METKPNLFSSVQGKRAFVDPTHIQFQLLKELLKKRLEDSNGETIFEIGVCENEENGLVPNEYAQSVCIHFCNISFFAKFVLFL